MCFEDLVATFAAYLEVNGRSQKTIYGYKSDIRRFKAYYEDYHNVEWYVEETTTGDVEAFLQMLYEKDGLQPASRNRILHCLRSFFMFACNRGLTNVNPTIHVKAVRSRRRERMPIIKHDFAELIEHISHPVVKVATKTLWYTGLRISELTKLSVMEVDLEASRIKVIGIEDADRYIPIHPVLHRGLSEYASSRSSARQPYDRFFATEVTGQLSPSHYNRVLKETVQSLNWDKNVTAHTFRHSFATNLANERVPHHVIQHLLGHAPQNVTQGYMHARADQLVQAINLLE